MLGHRTLSGSKHTMLHWRERKPFVIAGALILLGIGVVFWTLRPASITTYETSVPDTLPLQLSDADFWELIESFSEPNGYFRSDNLTSNELLFQHVIGDLVKRTRPLQTIGTTRTVAETDARNPND